MTYNQIRHKFKKIKSKSFSTLMQDFVRNRRAALEADRNVCRNKLWETKIKSQETTDLRIQPKITIRLYSDSDLCRLIYIGKFEFVERVFVNDFLRPGDCFVDVGANIGLFSLIASRLVGKTGKVYSFEPSKNSYLRLLENLDINKCKNTFCYQLALSDQDSHLDLTISLDGFDAWNSFGTPTAGQSFTTEKVQSITWDNFYEKQGLKDGISLMKIDVEGWESYVIRGAQKLLEGSNAPVLLVEFTERNCQGANSSCKEIYFQLVDLGYQLFTYDYSSRELVIDPLREHYPYLNLIATKSPEKVISRVKRGFRPIWIH